MHELFIFIFFLIALVLFFILRANHQTPNEIISRYIEAIGGEKRLAGISQVGIEGVLNKNSQENNISINIIRGASFSIDYRAGEQYGKLYFEKNREPSYFSTTQIIPDFISLIQNSLQTTSLDTVGDLYNFKQKGFTAYFTGTEIVEGSKCYKILLRAKDASACLYLIDVNSHLLLGQRILFTSDENHTGNEVRLCIKFTNYKNFEGFLFPGEIRIDGNPEIVFNVKNIRFDFPPFY